MVKLAIMAVSKTAVSGSNPGTPVLEILAERSEA